MSLVSRLIEAYIGRESEKIVDLDGAPLLRLDFHRQIFEEAAEHMWLNGDRKLSADDLRTIAVAIAEQANLRGSDAQQFETKITSYAGFQLSTKRDSFSFEHEVYFDYFFAEAAVRLFKTGSDVGNFLDRGLIGERVCSLIVAAVGPAVVAAGVSGRASAAATHGNRRRNAGQLVGAAARSAEGLSGQTLADMDFVGMNLSGSRFTECRFEGCEFVDVGLDHVKIERCEVERCSFAGIGIGKTSKLGLRGPDLLRSFGSVIDLDGEYELFSPVDIASTLEAAGMEVEATETPLPEPTVGPRAERVALVLHRLSRRFEKTTLVVPDDENDAGGRLFDDAAWHVLHGLLTRHGLINEGTRPASGRRKQFIRPAVKFRDLLRREKAHPLRPGNQFDEFWRDVRALD